jgi:hydrogenase small subunit
MPESYFQWLLKKNNRRDFLKFVRRQRLCMAGASAVPRSFMLWRPNPACVNISIYRSAPVASESFLRSGHPLTANLVLNLISLDYMNAAGCAGEQDEAAKLKP